MKLRAAIRKLKQLRDRMRNPAQFYDEHLEAWKELARQTATDILLANRPPKTDAEEWGLTVAHVAGLVGASMQSLEAVGVAIYLERAGARTLEEALFGALSGELTLEEIASYVAAGRVGDPKGKADFTEEDRHRTDEQVAMNILRAIEKGDASPGREPAIREFLAARFGDDAQALFPAIRQAWVEVFSVRAAADWRAWWKWEKM